MNTKALITLEYDKIIKKLETFASSTMGKALCKDLLPSSDYEEILSAQTETKDALTRLYKTGYLSFQGLSDIRPHLRLLEIDSTLNTKELLDIARLLSITAQAVEYGDTEDDIMAYDSLNSYFGELDSLEFLYQRITQCILSEDEISDDASSALKDIRREIKQTNISIHNKLTSVINSQNNKTMLQDALITVRNGRYCVPVKTEYRNAFPGMIHDQSSSGSTLFIEPMAVVQLNNHLKELDIKEKMEIEKILQSLSAQAASCSRELEENQKILTKLDFIFAKAKYAKEYQGTEPIFNTDGIVDIKQGRHPLLDPKKVVPIHIYIGEDFNMLLLTGPNTGGKTVSLKTVGLFQLMGQAGLHIPAFQGSRLAVFSDIFADIGDEQSIEMNLSTFSSHMTNLVHILDEADPNSLVLIGIPGKSNAFSISERLGLPDYIIEQARSQIDATAIDFENMLSELEKNKAEIEKEQSELYKTKQEIENLKNSLKEKQDDIKEKRDKMLRDAREEARNILEEAKEVADESIRKYHAWGQHPKQKWKHREVISEAA